MSPSPTSATLPNVVICWGARSCERMTDDGRQPTAIIFTLNIVDITENIQLEAGKVLSSIVTGGGGCNELASKYL